MGKKNGEKKQNVTYERLADLPFENARSLKQAQKEIRLRAWSRLEEARALDSLSKKQEYEFWRRELETGLCCKCGDDELVRVSSQGRGIQVSIHESLRDPQSEALLRILLTTLSDTFATYYFRVKGLLETCERLEPNEGATVEGTSLGNGHSNGDVDGESAS